MKLDPYKSKERHERWLKKSQSGIEGLSKIDEDLILQYLCDLEHGLNTAKGSKKQISNPFRGYQLVEYESPRGNTMFFLPIRKKVVSSLYEFVKKNVLKGEALDRYPYLPLEEKPR